MGQRLNVSIRENERILASGYWHWCGFTNEIIGIISNVDDILPYKEHLKKDYTSEELSIAILECFGCRVFNDRNRGRIKIGYDQDTSEANVIIDLNKDYVQLIDCFYNVDDNDDSQVIMNIPIDKLTYYLNEMHKCEKIYTFNNKQYEKIL